MQPQDQRGGSGGTSWNIGSLDLRPVHDAPRFRIERVAPMHCRAVVPKNQIPQRPAVPVNGRVDVSPELIQQSLRFRHVEPHNVRITTATKVQGEISRDRMRDDSRVGGAY